MTKRRSKKNKSGSHGYGSSKKNRGAGNRGGRGNAGRGKKAKHKKMTKDGIHQLGEKGFNSRKDPQNGINLRDIDQRIEEFVEQGAAEEEDGEYVFYAEKAGYDKILGKGRLTRPVEVHAENFSSSAEEKIKDADGQAITEE
ncbi:uL15m family ribosomal protein [Candidatus Nanohalococcus occultus]|uniref:Large ribosomal subunit protein uL15 n=1 Tax=Candidatus Nanohalococcus occultus TaxID=2978047 RepID=A0ABY8CHB1_9ARCH|nr:Ribosomal protein L15 [Candidatus Nanohaloarchaeota archaeon SVXNc]